MASSHSEPNVQFSILCKLRQQGVMFKSTVSPPPPHKCHPQVPKFLGDIMAVIKTNVPKFLHVMESLCLFLYSSFNVVTVQEKGSTSQNYIKVIMQSKNTVLSSFHRFKPLYDQTTNLIYIIVEHPATVKICISKVITKLIFLKVKANEKHDLQRPYDANMTYILY